MKLFKIFSENPTHDINIHHGYCYKEGLNIDPVSSENGACDPGGFYLVGLDFVFAFTAFGDLIGEVEVPDDAILEKYRLGYLADQIVLKNIRPFMDPDTIQGLFEQGADKERWLKPLFTFSASHHNVPVLKYLLRQGADIYMENDLARRVLTEEEYQELKDFSRIK